MSQDLNISYNEKNEIISLLTEIIGRNILEIEISNSSRFFDVKEFEAPVGGSVSAAPFFTFSGIDITDYLTINTFTLHIRNMESLKNSFESFVQNKKNHSFKFSDLHIWRYYSY